MGKRNGIRKVARSRRIKKPSVTYLRKHGTFLGVCDGCGGSKYSLNGQRWDITVKGRVI